MMNNEIFQPELRITKISFNHFRGFEHLELPLQPHLNVFIGENGAGKTALLDGIAKLLTRFAGEMSPPDSEYQPIQRSLFDFSDIQKGQRELEMFLELSLGEDQTFGVEATFKNKPMGTKFKNSPHNGAVEEWMQHADQSSLNLPVMVYFPASNAPVNSISFQDTPEDFETHIFTAYHDALTKQPFNFTKFFAWYRWQENIEKQLGQNLVLQQVRQAIYQILSDDQNRFEKLTINWLTGPTGEMLIEKNGVALHINQLSSGEKTLLALVADCSHRLALANPHRDNPLLGYGVVLVDEIDLHLHPRWQRRLIPKLQQTFPNCQWIVTTHSPLVLSYVPHEHVKVLKNFQIIPTTPFTFGRDTHSILFELMGVRQRPEEMQAKINQCYEWIDLDKLEEAEECFKRLAEVLGPNDPEVVRGESIIQFHKD